MPGCVFGEAGVSFDAAQVIPAPLEYQNVPITLAGTPPVVPSNAAPPPHNDDRRVQLQTFARSGAAGRAPVRHVGRARFRNDAVEGAATLRAARWAIVPNGRGRPAAAVDPDVTTWSEDQGVLKHESRRARWQLVPAHEVEG